jgi:hypothetical protein
MVTTTDNVLKGRIARGGRSAEGIYVRVHSPGGDFVGEVRTDEDGSFFFHLPLGTWFLVAFAPGGARVTQEVTFTGPEPQAFVIELGD